MLLKLNNIRKYFPVKGGFFGTPQDYVKAVDGLDLTVAHGENVSLVGESGCGKTTLARIIMHLTAHDEGEIHFNGLDISYLDKKNNREYRKQIQMVFQDPYSSLDPRFSIRRVLYEGLTLDTGHFWSKSEKHMRAVQLLNSVGLNENILSRYPHEFSGGERQRIAIARALMLNPRLLILDEAVSSLDVIIQKQIIDLLEYLQQKFNLTYLFISHNLKVVRKISHKIAVMYKGKIIELAPTSELFHNPLHPYTRELLSAAIDYKAVKRDKEFSINPQARLIDQGAGHFVMEH